MKTVDTLPKTTFSGRRFTRKQLSEVQETVQIFSNLSRSELAFTVCEHLDWKTPKGSLKIKSCLALLEALEAHGLISLPAKEGPRTRARRTPTFVEQPETSPIEESLSSIAPITLRPVKSPEDRERWKAYLENYHYLGFRRPFGAHLGYFIVSEAQRRELGCFVFTASAAWTLAPRDKWIGWDSKHRKKLLQLILSNDRFLIFPWVKAPHLASHALSLATRRIGDDWVESYGYRPVLIETFVEPSRFSGACYRAANWRRLGQTQGRGLNDPRHEYPETKKDIYVYNFIPGKGIDKEMKLIRTLKKKIKGAFQYYLTPSVVNEILKNPDMLKLGGEKKELTVMFSDIRGFTSISEKLDPESLVRLLNEYLTAMTDIIFEFEGLLDKYIGDAIMAVFGAPLYQPDHPKRGCATALKMIEKLNELKKKWKNEGFPEINIGIGINTGPMVVGNMGSQKRFDYTVMGDSVNLGSRLEGINKQYGTNIIISEFTKYYVQDEFLLRELDMVRVKGKEKPVKIYELIDWKGKENGWNEIISLFNTGLTAYRNMDWKTASDCFGNILKIKSDDGPSLVYLERCKILRDTPPPEGWDGVFTMKTK